MADDSVFGDEDAAADDPAKGGEASADASKDAGDNASQNAGAKDASGGDASKDDDSKKASDAGDGGGGGDAASVPAPSGPGVNSMILDAVKQSNSAVLGSASNNGSAIAYQKVAQATAFAVQDSTDFLRNIMAMSAAATGVALKKMVEDPTTAPKYTPVLDAAQKAVTAAQSNFEAVGTSAGKVVSGFPSGS